LSTKTHDYTKLDAAIIAAIRSGKVKLYEIERGAVMDEARKINSKEWGRAVDRRLQALRKAGRINYNYSHRHGWQIGEGA
jgi:hypothetical protein